jgi:hypothetical protein
MKQRLSRTFGKRRQRKAGRVVKTSVLAWLASDRTGRAVSAARMLRKLKRDVTSAELTRMVCGPASWRLPLERVLNMRRGLSDALARGAVVHAGKRRCTETGRMCVTWRVATR